MLNPNEYMPGRATEDTGALQSWIDRCRKRREKLARREKEAERFARRQRMILGTEIEAIRRQHFV